MLFRSYFDSLNPVIAPDGSVYFTSSHEDAEGNIYRISKAGDEPERIAASAEPEYYPALSSSGKHLAYTVSGEENEGIIDHLLNERKDAELIPFTLPLKRSDPITAFEKYTYSEEVRKTLRLWPQDNNTEGFFVAKIRKNS